MNDSTALPPLLIVAMASVPFVETLSVAPGTPDSTIVSVDENPEITA